MKIGVSLKVDVTKLDKQRFFKGEKGTYADMTVFVDIDQPDQYGNNGMITQDVSKEEKAQGVQGAILGNCKVFWKDNQSQPNYQQSQPQGGYVQPNGAPMTPQQVQQHMQAPQDSGFDDSSDLPF